MLQVCYHESYISVAGEREIMPDLLIRIPQSLAERYSDLKDRVTNDIELTEIRHPGFMRLLITISEEHYSELLELARKGVRLCLFLTANP